MIRRFTIRRNIAVVGLATVLEPNNGLPRSLATPATSTFENQHTVGIVSHHWLQRQGAISAIGLQTVFPLSKTDVSSDNGWLISKTKQRFKN